MENKKALILSIDAWRDREGWTWNNHYRVGEVNLEETDLTTNRKILAFLRKEGYLADGSKGRVRVDSNQGYEGFFVEIQAMDGEPLFAISQIHG
jgi:hypothetical protein